MLYLKHDFYSNFSSSIDSGDNDIITDILVDELSELIVYNRESLIEMLNKISVKVNHKISDNKLVDVIVLNISKNPKITKGLAFLIAQNNNNIKSSKRIRSKNGQETVLKSGETPATINQIDMINSGIIGIADSFKYKPQLSKEFKIRLMEKIKTKIKAVGDREVKHVENNTGKYILLGLFLIGAGIGIYYLVKNKKKKAENGLELDNVDAIGNHEIDITHNSVNSQIEPTQVIKKVEPISNNELDTPIGDNI